MSEEWMPLLESARLPNVPAIYVVRHRASGREYVGLTKSLRTRIRSHRSAPAWHYFGRALRAHGLAAFDVCALHLCAVEDLDRLEQETIAARGCRAPAGYNLAAGGFGPTGVPWSYERKLAQSVARTGFQHRPDSIEKMRQFATTHNGFKGKRHTAETKAKMAAAAVRLHTGMKRSAEARANISASLKGRAPTVLSPEARARIAEAHRKPNPNKSQPGERNGNAKRVGLWVPNSLTPAIFGTATEAARWAGVSLNLMSQWCYGRESSLGNWSYI